MHLFTVSGVFLLTWSPTTVGYDTKRARRLSYCLDLCTTSSRTHAYHIQIRHQRVGSLFLMQRANVRLNTPSWERSRCRMGRIWKLSASTGVPGGCACLFLRHWANVPLTVLFRKQKRRSLCIAQGGVLFVFYVVGQEKRFFKREWSQCVSATEHFVMSIHFRRLKKLLLLLRYCRRNKVLAIGAEGCRCRDAYEINGWQYLWAYSTQIIAIPA